MFCDVIQSEHAPLLRPQCNGDVSWGGSDSAALTVHRGTKHLNVGRPGHNSSSSGKPSGSLATDWHGVWVRGIMGFGFRLLRSSMREFRLLRSISRNS